MVENAPDLSESEVEVAAPQARRGFFHGFWFYFLLQPLVISSITASLPYILSPSTIGGEFLPWPFMLISLILMYYLIFGWFGAPLWYLVYRYVTRRISTGKIKNSLHAWIVYSVLGVIPAYATVLPVILGESISDKIEFLSYFFVTSPVGAGLYLALMKLIGRESPAGHTHLDSDRDAGHELRQSAAVLIACLFPLLLAGIGKGTNWYFVNVPDNFLARRAVHTLLGDELANETRNAYYFTQKGVFLAGGDPETYHYRFEAGNDTIKKIIEKMRLIREYEDGRLVAKSNPDWWKEGRIMTREPYEETGGKFFFVEAEHYTKGETDFWVDREENRIFVFKVEGWE